MINTFVRFLSQNNLMYILMVLGSLFLLYNILLIIWIMYQKKHFYGDMSYGLLPRIFRYWLVCDCILFALSITTIATMLTINPKVTSPSEPSLGITVVSNAKPISIKFDRPINKDKLKYQITPALKGDWSLNTNILSKSSQLFFTPIESPSLDTRYTISLTDINNIFSTKQNNYLFSFQTPPIPKIISTSIKEGEEGILPNVEIKVECEPIIDKTAEFDFELSPDTEIDTVQNNSTFVIKPKTSLHKGSYYTLKGYRTLSTYNYQTGTSNSIGEREELLSMNFKTMDAPGVKSTSPLGSGVLTDSSVKVIFSQNMNRVATEKAFSILPQMNGSFSWSDDRTLTFKPSSVLAKNTKYTVGISTGAQAADLSILEEAISFQFTTIGYVQASGFSPANSATNIDTNSNISVTFNQPVDHTSAEKAFSISPTLSGTFSWNSNTLTFKHTGMSTSQKYSITISSNIKSVNGLDSIDVFTSSFTTKTPAVTLNIPSYHQAHMYSCMASAARSALAFKGVSISEDSVLSHIGYDNTAWSGSWNESGAIWGDPDSGIVGSVDGKANNIGWGYGAHWRPVASAINTLGRSAEVKSGWSVSGIASEIAAGNPVIIWWVNGVWPAYEVNWKTPDGKNIRGVNSMHVQVVKGFTGSVDNPQSFTVTDSGYGYPGKSFDVGTFKAKWSWFGNTGIVVR